MIFNNVCLFVCLFVLDVMLHVSGAIHRGEVDVIECMLLISLQDTLRPGRKSDISEREGEEGFLICSLMSQ